MVFLLTLVIHYVILIYMLNKTEFLILRISPDTKKKIAKLAKEKRTTVSKFIRGIIETNI